MLNSFIFIDERKQSFFINTNAYDYKSNHFHDSCASSFESYVKAYTITSCNIATANNILHYYSCHIIHYYILSVQVMLLDILRTINNIQGLIQF